MKLPRLNRQQRGLLAGFGANGSVLFVGYGLTDQPVATIPMTWKLRGCIMFVS